MHEISVPMMPKTAITSVLRNKRGKLIWFQAST